MNFLHPEVLYYLLPLLFVLFGFLLSQKEAEAHYFSQEVMNKLRVSANTLTLKARNALFFLVGFLILLALSGPVINEGTVEVKAKSADIMIALDISDSMLAEDLYPNRLKSAKQKAIELLKLAPNERIGVIAFAKNSYLVSPLSFDHGAVSFLLRQLNTDSITEKGTNFLSLLDVVDNSIKNSAKKYLLIISDGGDKSDFSKEIAYAKDKNIVVFILGMGTEKGAPIKLKNGSFIKQHGDIIISKLNENISALATKSGGVYIESVNSDEDIKTMLNEIESIADEKELKSEEVQKFIPLFYYPLGLALIILLIATSSMSKREKVHLPSMFLLFSLLFSQSELEAGLFDFMELDKAKKAYESGEYEESQKLYNKYAQSSKSGESYYNSGNSLYKQGKYKEAIESYQKATFDSASNRAKNHANIANAHVKSKEKESLQKAVEAYEKSLKIEEDKDTRENLEAVKKAIEEQKKQEEKENKDNKEKKDEDKKEKDKDSQKDKKGDEDKKSDDEKKSDKKDEKSKEDEAKKDGDKKKDSDKQDKQDKKDGEQKESEDLNKTKEQEKKEDLEELNKDENNSTKESPQSQAAAPNDKMSEAEEQKWLKELNKAQNTYMYMLNNQQPKEDNLDEKPW